MVRTKSRPRRSSPASSTLAVRRRPARSGTICARNGAWVPVRPSMRNCRTTRPSSSACTATLLAARPCASSTRSNLAFNIHGGPGGCSVLLGVGGRGGVCRPRRGARSSTAPPRLTVIGPAAGRLSVPCAVVRPSSSRSRWNTESRPPLNSALARTFRASPSSCTASMLVIRSWSSSTCADAFANASRGLRHSSGSTNSSVPVRSAVTAASPCPLRRSVSAACTCIGPLSSDVASSPIAASCRASGCADIVTLCVTWVGGPARKSIAASSFAGIDASTARPFSFIPSEFALRSNAP